MILSGGKREDKSELCCVLLQMRLDLCVHQTYIYSVVYLYESVYDQCFTRFSLLVESFFVVVLCGFLCWEENL